MIARLVLSAVVGSSLALASDFRQTGHNHFYNLEYDEAIGDYTRLIEQVPRGPERVQPPGRGPAL